MADPVAIELHANGVETAAGSGSVVDLDERGLRSAVLLTLTVSACVGALNVYVETSRDGSSGWRRVGFFDAVTSVSERTWCFAGCNRFVRAVWTVATSATFSLSGHGHVLYATPSDLGRAAINEQALSGISQRVLADCCLRASADAQTALNSSYELPITSWDEDLRGHCAARAAYYAMNHRGRAPSEDGPDSLIDIAGGTVLQNGSRSAAQRYFDDVASGKLKPVGIVDRTPDDFEGAGCVVSGVPRRW